MAKFDVSRTNVSEINTPDTVTPFIDPVAPVVDVQGAQNLQEAGFALEIGTRIRDEVILSEKEDQLEEVKTLESEYKRLKSNVLQQLGSADGKELDARYKELRKLRAGQDSRYLTPTEANAKRKLILKETLNNAPRIANEVRALINVDTTGRSSGARSGLSTTDLVEKEYDKMAAEAARSGRSLQYIREKQRMKDAAEFSTNQMTILKNNGDLQLPQFLRSVSDRVNVEVSEVLTNLQEMSKRDPLSLDKDDLNAQVSVLIDQLKDKARRDAMSRSIDSRGRVKFLFEPSDMEEVDKLIDEKTQVLKDFIKAKDKNAFLKREMDLSNNLGAYQFMRMYPFESMIANLTQSPQYAVDLIKSNQKMSSIYLREGGRKQIDLMSKSSGRTGEEARMFLLKMKYEEGEFLKDLYSSTQDGRAHVQEYGANQSAANFMAANSLGIPISGGEEEQREKVDANMVKTLTNINNNPKELGHFLRDDIFVNIINNPEAMESLDARTKRLQADSMIRIKTMDAEDIPDVEFIVDNGELKMVSMGEEEGARDLSIAIPTHGRVSRNIFRIKSDFEDILKDINLTTQIRSKYGMTRGLSREDYFRELAGVWNDAMIQGRKNVDKPTKGSRRRNKSGNVVSSSLKVDQP